MPADRAKSNVPKAIAVVVGCWLLLGSVILAIVTIRRVNPPVEREGLMAVCDGEPLGHAAEFDGAAESVGVFAFAAHPGPPDPVSGWSELFLDGRKAWEVTDPDDASVVLCLTALQDQSEEVGTCDSFRVLGESRSGPLVRAPYRAEIRESRTGTVLTMADDVPGATPRCPDDTVFTTDEVGVVLYGEPDAVAVEAALDRFVEDLP